MEIKLPDMKNILLSLILGTPILLSVCKGQEPPQKGYVLKGFLNGIETGAVKVIEFNEDDRTSKVIDSGTIAGGSFVLTGSVGVPKMVSVQIDPGNWSFPVFLEDTTLQVTVDTAGAQHFDYTKYGGKTGAVIKHSTETGSRNFNDWMQYEDNPGRQQYAPVFAVLNAKLKATKDIDAQYKVRDEIDSVGQLQRALDKRQIDAYVQSNPSSVAGIYMFDQFYLYSKQMPAGEMDSMLGKFEGQAKASLYYARLERELAKKKAVEPGQTAPDFTLLKRDSTAFALSSLRGAYTMIDFWASWCHPCREAIPHWKEVYQKYHAKGLEIVSVSDDSRWNDWKKAMDQEKMPWTQVCDEFPLKNMPARVGSLYMTTFIPFYVLLDKEGKILEYTGDETKIDARLAELFGHKQDGYTITGYIHGNAEGKKVYLKYADTLAYDPRPFDSTVIHNGQFLFKGSVASPRLLCVSIEQPPVPNRAFQDKVFDLFVENTPITVHADIDSLDLEVSTLNGTLSVNAAVEGSPSHAQFMQFYSVKGRMDRDRMRIFDEYIGFLNPDSGTVRQGKEVGIRLVQRMDSVLAVQKDWVMQYITGQVPSEALAYAALQAIRLSNITVPDIDRLTGEFSTAGFQGPLKDFFLRQAALAVKSSVGAKAPDFVLMDMDGKEHKLTEFIGKGRYVLVDFWASWCHPCRADLPHLREAFDAYHDKGFDVLSISMDTKKDNWIKAVGEEGLQQKWPQLCDPKAFEGDIAKTYHIMGIPLAILYDPSGHLVTRNLRGSWMDAFLIGKYGDLF